MKYFNILTVIFSIFFSIFAINAMAQDENQTVIKKVYMFGIANNYQDSVTYLTNIVPIEKAVFDKNTGYMNLLEVYSNQLQTYLLKQGHAGYICTTFYTKEIKKTEELYLKIKRRINKDKGTKIQMLSDFTFQQVNHGTIYKNNIKKKAEDDDNSGEESSN